MGRNIQAVAQHAQTADAISNESSTDSGGSPPWATAQYGAVQDCVSAE